MLTAAVLAPHQSTWMVRLKSAVAVSPSIRCSTCPSMSRVKAIDSSKTLKGRQLKVIYKEDPNYGGDSAVSTVVTL